MTVKFGTVTRQLKKIKINVNFLTSRKILKAAIELTAFKEAFTMTVFKAALLLVNATKTKSYTVTGVEN